MLPSIVSGKMKKGGNKPYMKILNRYLLSYRYNHFCVYALNALLRFGFIFYQSQNKPLLIKFKTHVSALRTEISSNGQNVIKTCLNNFFSYSANKFGVIIWDYINPITLWATRKFIFHIHLYNFITPQAEPWKIVDVIMV